MRLTLAAFVLLLALGIAADATKDEDLDMEIILSDMPLDNLVTAARTVH